MLRDSPPASIYSLVHPTFTLGPFVASSFSAMNVLAILLGAGLGAWQAARAGVDWRDAVDIALWAGIAGLIGAKVFTLVRFPHELANFSIAKFRSTRLVWYGGLIGGAAVGVWRARRLRLPVSGTLDQGACAVAAGHAVGRVGCFLAGDDYGFSTTLPWGILLPLGAPPSTAGYLRAHGERILASIPDSQIMAVHPAMLYESIGNIAIAAYLWRRSHGAYRPWSNIALYCVCYGALRFCVEFVRVKDDRLPIGITIAQIVSVGMLALGAVLLVWTRRARPETIQQQLAAMPRSALAT